VSAGELPHHLGAGHVNVKDASGRGKHGEENEGGAVEYLRKLDAVSATESCSTSRVIGDFVAHDALAMHNRGICCRRRSCQHG
jgi:hypothetical protein